MRDFGNTLTLLLNSPGGDVDEAIKIGRLARELMAKVSVHGNLLYTLGTPHGTKLERFGQKYPPYRVGLVAIKAGDSLTEQDLVRCYSACVLIFYGGVDRGVSDNWDQRTDREKSIPAIGLHRPYFAAEAYASLSPIEAKQQYAILDKEVRDYLVEMGAPQDLADHRDPRIAGHRPAWSS